MKGRPKLTHVPCRKRKTGSTLTAAVKAASKSGFLDEEEAREWRVSSSILPA